MAGVTVFQKITKNKKMTFLMKIAFIVLEVTRKWPGRFTFLNMLLHRKSCAYMIFPRFPS
jgi:hypothetical protein